MKNKKEIISIVLAFILVIASIVTMIVKKELDNFDSNYAYNNCWRNFNCKAGR